MRWRNQCKRLRPLFGQGIRSEQFYHAFRISKISRSEIFPLRIQSSHFLALLKDIKQWKEWFSRFSFWRPFKRENSNSGINFRAFWNCWAKRLLKMRKIRSISNQLGMFFEKGKREREKENDGKRRTSPKIWKIWFRPWHFRRKKMVSLKDELKAFLINNYSCLK